MLSIALLDDDASDRVPTSHLLQWLDRNAGSSLLAARRLASRDDVRQAGRVQQLLASPDRDFRAAALRGLGKHRRRERTGDLVRAYAFEADATVRQAIARALWERPAGAERDRALRHAALSDPDARVRAIAGRRSAKPMPRSAWPLVGHEAVWLQVSGTPKSLVAVLTDAGVAVPVSLPQDGHLLLLGLGGGAVQLRIASEQSGSTTREKVP